LIGSVSSRPATTVLQCKVTRHDGGFGINVNDSFGACVVQHLVGNLQVDSELMVADRITHVDGEGPLDYKAVVEALADSASDTVVLTIVRGEQPPPPIELQKHTLWQRSILALALVLVLGSFASVAARAMAPPEKPVRDMNETRMSPREKAHKAKVDDLVSRAGAAADRRHKLIHESDGLNGFAIWIRGKTFALKLNGAPRHPESLREAMLADKQHMEKLRSEMPKWAAAIEDRTKDKAFVKETKSNFKSMFAGHDDDESPGHCKEAHRWAKGKGWWLCQLENAFEMKSRVDATKQWDAL
jgi:hypothetical protein